METQSIVVDEVNDGQRIDVLLALQLANASRSFVQKLIQDGCVLVNGETVKANYRVRQQDVVKVSRPEVKPLEVNPESIPLNIVFEDDQVIVVNKPRGMVVHPAAGNYHGTLVNALLMHCDDLSGINGVARPGIVHRLDKDTSGVMVVAKTDQAHVSLAHQIKERSASRRYLAIVHGNIKEETGIIDAPIGRHPVDRKRMAVVFMNSKPAITKFRVMERFGDYTLVQCKLQTGRTHQIRVHMAYIGHPVAGDPKYGPARREFGIAGQALHSAELTFTHPVTGQVMYFTAPLPMDMQQILASLRMKNGR